MNGIRILIEENRLLLKKMDVTDYTGHVTFFLVNLVVSVNGLSFFFAIETIPLLFLTPCKLDKVKIFAINRKQRDSRAEGLNLRCSQAPKRTCESFKLKKKQQQQGSRGGCSP